MINIIKTVLAVAAFSLLAGNAGASENQTKLPSANASISGKVIDYQSGETLAGVSVLVEGTETKVYTDLDGNFSIEGLAPGSYNLVLSMISYKSSLVENVELLPEETEEISIKLDNIR